MKTISAKRANEILKSYDLGDDFLEDDNQLFDPSGSGVVYEDLVEAHSNAISDLQWYFDEFGDNYLLVDCNWFHYQVTAKTSEFLVRFKRYRNPWLGRAYGYWEGVDPAVGYGRLKMLNHCWGWCILDTEDLVWLNWTEILRTHKIDGRGSHAI